jgi:hypothetical protein
MVSKSSASVVDIDSPAKIASVVCQLVTLRIVLLLRSVRQRQNENANVINRSRVRALHVGQNVGQVAPTRLFRYESLLLKKLLFGDIRDLSSIRTFTRVELR